MRMNDIVICFLTPLWIIWGLQHEHTDMNFENVICADKTDT